MKKEIDDEWAGIDCSECNYLIEFMPEYKFPDVCGQCGRTKEELIELQKGYDKKGENK